jgi:hypothetical protein
MKRLLRIFELSKNEQRVVLIVLFILITLAFVEYKRRVHHSAVEAGLVTESKPSPTAVETVRDQ